MFRVKVSIPEETVVNLICSACEGGSRYWAKRTTFRTPAKVWSGGYWDGNSCAYQYPVSIGGSITFEDILDEGRERVLDKKACEKGLELLSLHKPKTFAQVVLGNFDANVADEFLQFALLGELSYG